MRGITKKLSLIVLLFIVTVALVGCNKTDDPEVPTCTANQTLVNNVCVDDEVDPDPDPDPECTAPQVLEGGVCVDPVASSPYDFDGEIIVILHGALHTVDPFHEDYTGQYQDEKQALQTYIEEYYNVEIRYQLFPDNAGWGPDRQTAIINGVISGDPIGHIYALDSRWIGTLAEAGALANLSPYESEVTHDFYAENTHAFGMYKDGFYGIQAGVTLATSGLYFNMDLLESIGKESPAELWNDGEWTWADFNLYVADVQAALDGLGEGYYAVGGAYSYWGQYMVPANGGYLVNPFTKTVALTQTKALDTFQFLHDLNNTGAWEPTPSYDSGSAAFTLGKVLMHPGELWYITSDARWGNLEFNLGYVPYPIGDDTSMNDYQIGVYGIGVWAISSGFEKADNPDGINDEILYKIWTGIQYWSDPADELSEFETILETRYHDLASIEAHMSVCQKVYFEQLFNLGISGFDPTAGFYTISNRAIKDGNIRSEFEAIIPVYQQKLDDIFGN